MARLFLSLLVCLFGIVTATNKCENWLIKLKDKEKALLNDSDAVRNLEEAFYPVNEHSSLIVEVKYRLLPNGDEPQVNEEMQAKGHSSILTRNRKVNRLQGHKILKRRTSLLNQAASENTENYFTFRWMNSPTYLFINPELLRGLSLFTYSYSQEAMPVELNFSVPCTWSELQQFIPTSKHGCPDRHHDLALRALNNFTSILDSLILHRSSVFEHGMPEDKERGYVLYYYDPSEPSGYCILDEEGQYEKQRKYLGVTIGGLLAFIAFCVPLVFYMIFNKLHEVMKQPQNDEPKNNWRYFIWSTVATCCFLSLLVSGFDVYVFATNLRYYPHSNNKENHYMYRIYVFFCVVIALMILGFLVDIGLIIGCVYLIKQANSGDKFIKDIEIPVWFHKVLKIFRYFCCCCVTRNQQGTGSSSVQVPQEHEDIVGIRRTGQVTQEPEGAEEIRPAGQVTQEPEGAEEIRPAGQVTQEPEGAEEIRPAGQVTQEPEDAVGVRPARQELQEPEQKQPCTCDKKICAQSVALCFGNFMVTAFLQLIGFHVFFIGLGVLATPVHSLSMTGFFVSFFVLSIVFFATLLKITNTENCWIFSFSFILVLLGLTSFISLVLYYYNYFLVVEDYNYDSGIATLLGHILPIAVSGVLIFCGKRLVQYVREGGFIGRQTQVIPVEPQEVRA